MSKKNDKKMEIKLEPKFQAIPIKSIPIYIVLLIFAVTTLIFFYNILAGNGFFWEDIVRFVYPLQNFAAKEGAKGMIPFWNPFTFSGMPFFADLQVGFFYPFNRLLSLFIGSNGNLSFSALQFMIILHFFISQINMYFLSRYFKTSSIGSIIGAIGYSFSLMMICHSIHPMIVQHLAWFPLVLMFFIKGVKDKDIKSGIISGLIYGGSMLSGHTQMSLYEGLILLFVFLWYLFSGIKIDVNKKKAIINPIISAGLTVVIAAGIFMVQYLPSSKYVELSKRGTSTYEFVTEGSLEFKQAFTAFVPDLFGSRTGNNIEKVPYHLEGAMGHIYWETSFYFGLAIVALGLFGFIAGFKRNDTKLLITLSIFSFLFALGSNGFIFDIFYELPFFGLFRNPVRMMFILILGFSVSAGFGFDMLFNNHSDKKTFKLLLLSMAIVLAFTLFGGMGVYTNAFNTPEEYKSVINGYAMIAFGITLLIAFLALMSNKIKINPLISGGIIALILFLDLYSAGTDFNKIDTDPNVFYTSVFTQSPQLKDTLSPKYPNDVFRVNMRLYNDKGQTMAKPMEDNQGMIDYIMLTEGYNPLILNRMNAPLASAAISKDMKNVKYELGIDSVARGLAFLKRPNAFGNAWLVYKYQYIPTTQLVAAAEKNNTELLAKVDFRNEVVLEKQLSTSYPALSADSVNHSIKVLKYENNIIEYKVSSDKAGILCFSEIYYPDWKAYIDGKPVEVIPANYSFRAIEFPAGDHKVEMKYESPEFAKGSTISLITLIVSLCGAFGLFFYEKKKK